MCLIYSIDVPTPKVKNLVQRVPMRARARKSAASIHVSLALSCVYTCSVNEGEGERPADILDHLKIRADEQKDRERADAERERTRERAIPFDHLNACSRADEASQTGRKCLLQKGRPLSDGLRQQRLPLVLFFRLPHTLTAGPPAPPKCFSVIVNCTQSMSRPACLHGTPTQL